MSFQIPLPPVGNFLQCKGWHQEAALRCLLNNLHPQVAENREELIVYGGIGKAARNKDCLERIIKTLKILPNDHTLLIQSGKPVAVIPTHEYGPRVLIANSNIVPHYANWDTFHELEKKNLMMYGQMTAGSWIYIGTQGILQGTYETFMACAQKHFGAQKDLLGKLVVSCGLGGMGGAQPLAVKMANGVFLGADVDKTRIEKRIKTKYIDFCYDDFSQALNHALDAKKNQQAVSIGVVGNAITFLEFLKNKNILMDVLTDQTSAHDPLNGYVPNLEGKSLSMEELQEWRRKDPKSYQKESVRSMYEHVKLMNFFLDSGVAVFDYGNNLRAMAVLGGMKQEEAFKFPGFVPAYIRNLFCQGSGPFRWVALSGDPQDIYKTDAALKELFPKEKNLHNWIDKAQKLVQFQGLPARICWLKYSQRELAGLLFNKMVREKIVSAPIVIGRDHLDCGSVASPNRETESMLDGSDCVSDWPILNALINTMNGASWTSFHHGGGVGMGYSQHAGMVIVADGSKQMDDRIKRVLNSDPGMGIIRHVDAGYKEALEMISSTNIQFPSV